MIKTKQIFYDNFSFVFFMWFNNIVSQEKDTHDDVDNKKPT